ncbi:hypothetical protein Pla163_13930 [Planctomycetes bacterium Pla163]|uniref:Uncharacterized protein n=1 Tax=Rohdeia mirabilis TaxID=2528008 RepID=A0A518CYJ4_9BACT|nr:hypothetical protein Pla163_13930 [Planctomycetes bacterium Pla163]
MIEHRMGERIEEGTGRRASTLSWGGERAEDGSARIASELARVVAGARTGRTRPVRRANGTCRVAWLERLSAHVERRRRAQPDAELAVLIDVDGSILDLRPGLAALLFDWDARRGTSYFDGLEAGEIQTGEAGLRRLFERRGLDHAARAELLVECERFAWSPEAVIGAHQPCLGMLEVLRWMQMQPRVFVVLNSSRSQTRRDETLQALRTLCRHYGMGLAEDRVRLNPFGDGSDGVRSKLAGIEHFKSRGLVPIAVVDDDTEALVQIDRHLAGDDVLCLLAEPFGRPTTALTPRVCVTEEGENVPVDAVSILWDGLATMDDLELFGAANVPWAQATIVRDTCGQLSTVPVDGPGLEFEELIGAFAQLGRGLRLSFEEPAAASRALGSIGLLRFPWERVSVRLRSDQLTDQWFERLDPYSAQVAIAVDGAFLAPLCSLAPDLVASALLRLREKGVARIVLPSGAVELAALAPLVRASGLELELATSGGIAPYVDAVLVGPEAVSTGFERERSRAGEGADSRRAKDRSGAGRGLTL